jgi:hypothetical protein
VAPVQILCAMSTKISLCLINEALRHEDVWGSECIDPRILDLGTSWRYVVSLHPGRFIPRERAPGTYWIVGPQNRSGRDGDEKKS